jgi:hypothetical protein
VSELAQRLERARRKHAAAVLEFQTDPCSTTWLAEFAARKAFEAEIQKAKEQSRE